MARWCLTSALLLTATSSVGAQLFQDFGPFMLDSDGMGELASSSFEVPITTTGLLELRYQAPSVHCASLKLHAYVDRREVAMSAPVAPNQRTDYLSLGPVQPGSHLVSLRAEGLPGGCNTGRVTSWGGKGTIWTSTPAPVSTLDLGDVVFDKEFVNAAWGYHFDGLLIDSKGRLLSYGLSKARHDALPEPKDDALSAHWLAARFESDQRELGMLTKDVLEEGCRLARSLKETSLPSLKLKPVAYDAGGLTYSIWVRNGAEYRQIVLAVRGDFEGDLHTLEATRLRDWMMRLLQKVSAH